MRWESRILGAIVAAALLVRATRIGESLWYDEIAAWRVYGMRGPGAIVGTWLFCVFLQCPAALLQGAWVLRRPAQHHERFR